MQISLKTALFKGSVFWDITPFSPVKVSLRLGFFSFICAYLLLDLLFNSKYGGSMFLRNVG
jgi:hypothetical protein